jgi:hypothetical protein
VECLGSHSPHAGDGNESGRDHGNVHR